MKLSPGFPGLSVKESGFTGDGTSDGANDCKISLCDRHGSLRRLKLSNSSYLIPEFLELVVLQLPVLQPYPVPPI